MISTAKVLGDALQVMRERGWCVNEFEDYKGRLCAQGAVTVALGKLEPKKTYLYWSTHDRDFDAAMEALVRQIPGDFKVADDLVPGAHNVVATYNNTRRHFEEIEKWFEAAATEEALV
jgi:hypothetical protein